MFLNVICNFKCSPSTVHGTTVFRHLHCVLLQRGLMTGACIQIAVARLDWQKEAARARVTVGLPEPMPAAAAGAAAPIPYVTMSASDDESEDGHGEAATLLLGMEPTN